MFTTFTNLYTGEHLPFFVPGKRLTHIDDGECLPNVIKSDRLKCITYYRAVWNLAADHA